MRRAIVRRASLVGALVACCVVPAVVLGTGVSIGALAGWSPLVLIGVIVALSVGLVVAAATGERRRSAPEAE